MANPIIAEITRGPLVESRHRGAFILVDDRNNVRAQSGATEERTFPRSAVKAFQCLPMIESGAAANFQLSDKEIALCCSSHAGEPMHVETARSILEKARVSEGCLACGAMLPSSTAAAHDILRQGGSGQPIHHTCSGKHSGMLAFAKHAGHEVQTYVEPDHPVQRAVAERFSDFSGCDVNAAPRGTDGCSVPTWALPMPNVALAFARLGASTDAAPQRIMAAARSHPEMIAGTTGFDTRVMQAVPRLFIKFGAEGVFCGAIPHARLGFMLKCDDGAMRAAEVGIAAALADLPCWSDTEQSALRGFASRPVTNARKTVVGEMRGVKSP